MNKAIENLIRPHYREMTGYVSAGMESGKGSNKIFMNANENPYELPGLSGMSRYPEPQPAALLEAYAKTYGVQPDQILATRGADESIKLLTRVFCEPHKDAVVIHPPTFDIYKVDAQSLPVNVVEVSMAEQAGNFILDVDAMIEAGKSDKVKIVFICSPNNPTGTGFAQDDILNICKELEGQCVVILDEAYIEFSEKSSLTSQLAGHPNLIILRTLSKAYALAGGRMGVTLCADPAFIAFMREKVSDIYPIPKPSCIAALRALDKDAKDDFDRNIQRILDEREKMRKIFRAMRLVKRTYVSDANFLLVKVEEAARLLEFLNKSDVILRDVSGQPGLENCIRITIGNQEQNEYLIKLMKRFEDELASAG